MVAAIDRSRTSVSIASHNALPEPIMLALSKAQSRGVKVRVVMDESDKTQIPALAKNGIEARMHENASIANSLIIDDTLPDAGGVNDRNKKVKNIFSLTNPRQRMEEISKWETLWQDSATAK